MLWLEDRNKKAVYFEDGRLNLIKSEIFNMSKIIDVRGVGEIFVFSANGRSYAELVLISGERKTFPDFLSAESYARGR